MRLSRKLPLTMTEATPFLPGLSPIGGKEITATFDGGQLSSDGGVLILREIEKRLGLARRSAVTCQTRAIRAASYTPMTT